MDNVIYSFFDCNAEWTGSVQLAYLCACGELQGAADEPHVCCEQETETETEQ